MNDAALADAKHELGRLLEVMIRLRDPETGCPWDREQTFETIAPYTIEEAYEVADAIARRDLADLPDELGDLLLQVVYHARIAEEGGHFAFADVARAIADKMIRRHPHIFAGTASDGWEEHKRRERSDRQRAGTLDGIPIGLPALTRALKITQRAGRVGFDWPDATLVLAKLEEEMAELRAELQDADPARLADEMGDILFVAANLARKLGLDPELCLRGANDKFSRRFDAVERRIAEDGLALADAGLDRMEAEWQAVKGDGARAVIGAITALLLCQLAGELLARGLHVPVPGPVIGMMLLFIALLVRRSGVGDAADDIPAPLAATGDALLGNLGLLFVPAGVGVVIYGPVLARDWVPISLAVVVGTGLGIAFTGRLAQALLRRTR